MASLHPKLTRNRKQNGNPIEIIGEVIFPIASRDACDLDKPRQEHGGAMEIDGEMRADPPQQQGGGGAMEIGGGAMADPLPTPPRPGPPCTPIKRRITSSPFCSPSWSVLDSGGSRRDIYGTHKRRRAGDSGGGGMSTPRGGGGTAGSIRGGGVMSPRSITPKKLGFGAGGGGGVASVIAGVGGGACGTPTSIHRDRNANNGNDNNQQGGGNPHNASSPHPTTAGNDRFIPCRSGMDMDLSHYSIVQANDENVERRKSMRQPNTIGGGFTPLKPEFHRTLKSTLLHSPTSVHGSGSRGGFSPGMMDGSGGGMMMMGGGGMSGGGGGKGSGGGGGGGDSVLSFHDVPTTNAYEQRMAGAYTSPLKMFQMDPADLSRLSPKVNRHIPIAPSRILDAPDLVDDYYLNLLTWGRRNILSVALGQAVYLWDAATGDIKHLLTLEAREDYVTSLMWNDTEHSSHLLAVGTNKAEIQLYDTVTLQKIRTLGGHDHRVSSLSWNDMLLSSGGRDAKIVNYDLRMANPRIRVLQGHTQEICGLRWSPDGTTLASGGNENYLCLWDAAMDTNGPRLCLTEHSAAVKALAWCPFQRRLLASGGGTMDRTIKFWNTATGNLLNSVDTGSQVCALLWSKHNKELVSSHGFSEFQLCLWKYPSMAKIKELKGHTARVLQLDQSPDGMTVVSAAADETLRFWDILGPPAGEKKKAVHGGPNALFLPPLSTSALPRTSAAFSAIR